MRAAVLVLAFLVAGCTAAPPTTQPGPGDGATAPPAPPPGPPGTVNLSMQSAHEHAAFALFLAGERVSFNHSAYDLQAVRAVRAHLHVQQEHGEHVIHVEDHFPGGAPNVTLAEFFGFHGLRFARGALTLDTRDGHNGTAWNDTPDKAWQVWSAPRNGTFAEVLDGPGLVLREGQRVLVTYAAPGDDLAAQQAAVPEPPRPVSRGNLTSPG